MENNGIFFSNFEKSLLSYPNVEELIKLEIFSENFKNVLKKFRDMTADIFCCDEFMKEINQNLDSTYLGEFFNELKNLITKEEKTIDTSNLSNFLLKIKEFNEKQLEKYSKYEIFVSNLIILYLFLQESVYGPSFFFIKETEKVDFVSQLNRFNNHFFFQIEKWVEDTGLQSQMIEYLSISGEEPYKHIKLLIFYVIVYDTLLNNSKIFENLEDDEILLNLWKSRVLFLQNKFLKEPVGILKEKIFDLLKLINSNEKLKTLEKNQLGLIKLEHSYYMLKYYKYKECENLVEGAKEDFNLKINLTGRLGRKTKYQVFDSAILVIEAQSSTLNTNKNSQEENPLTVKLDEENPLLESPNITDTTELISSDLSVYDHSYISAFIHLLHRSEPDEDLLREVILTYTNKCLNNSYDWLVYSKILLHRSLAENRKSKTIERSLLQIQSLCEQYNDRNPTPYNRLKFYFSLDYPLIWNLKKSYAEMFMTYGALLTAFEIFNELGMYEECVNCLYAAGKNDRAQQFAETIITKYQDPSVYCVLGEIQNKEEMFHKALEISKNKYIRAYRCLGKFFYVQNKIEEAAKWYEKALEINPLFPNVWFTLGCIYLKLANWTNAARAFSRCVQIDESNGEAWANLGSAFNQMNKGSEAIKCLEEGFKQSRDWRICENLMMMAGAHNELLKMITAINQLFMMDKHDRIKPNVFYKLITMFLTNTYDKLIDTDPVQCMRYRDRIYDIFEKYSQKDGLNSEIWDLYALFIESVELEACKGKISEQEKQTVYKRLTEIRLKQCRNIMIEDIWEKDEKMMEKIKSILEKINKEIKRISDENYIKELNHFVNNINGKIEKYYKTKEFNESLMK